ncbi:MAG: REP element-mobilizing transposase RayT [Porticoccaceae bacterium]|jgi:REP element-mobilizing transposase RayT
MARMPRKFVVDEDEVGVYHCINRCVRRAFLCGTDEVSGKCFDHRKQFIQDRLELLAGVFGIDVLAFAVMSNHLHVVLRNRPDVVKSWSDDEVARRWWNLFPTRRDDSGEPADPRSSDLSMIGSDPEKLAEIRRRLSNIGWLMRCVAEPVARMANREDECTGRFWEGRYKCQPLLDEAAVAACMAYVDLNPIRAGIAKTPESSQFTSAFERLKGAKDEGLRSSNEATAPTKLKSQRTRRGSWLSPVELALDHAAESEVLPRRRASNRGCLSMSEQDYLKLLDWSGRQLRHGKRGTIPAALPPIMARLGMSGDGWMTLMKDFGRLFHRAAGNPESLAREASRRKLKSLHGIRKSRAAFSPQANKSIHTL